MTIAAGALWGAATASIVRSASISMGAWGLRTALDHAAFGRNRPNADNVIESKSLERAQREKPVPTFSQRALVGVFRRLAP
ncbi:MAG: hypothetical protein CTY36_18135 [Methylocystis sp.]|nr:MAG: hypothetical protein CTY36_18135 [Methylocystis sp.]